MKQKQNLSLKQTQKITLNLQLQKSLKILQLSYVQMIDRVNKELEKNPLLELDSDLDNNKKEKIYKEKFFGSEQKNKKTQFIENTLEQRKNLREHIIEQINIDLHTPEEKIIAGKFLERIDPNGYINDNDVIEIYKNVEFSNHNITKSLVENTLKEIQNFDPSGVFARNLSECLEIQLKQKKILNSKYHFLVRNLELIAKKNIEILQKKTRLKKEEIFKMIKVIQSLNPKPAAIFDFEPNISIIPDIVLKLNKGSVKLEINKSEIPKFNFNKSFYNVIKNKKLLFREKERLKEWVNSGKLLVQSIKNREKTLEKVAKEIVNHQKKFFKRGINFFSPLTQKEIAKKTGLHESTISRSTTNKYIQTPKGTFELKYFFSKGINCGNNSEFLSNKIIKNKILLLIKKENKNNIMSDENIVFNLKKNGINIARRTVSKYRKLMKIPSSFKRKELIYKHY